MKTLQNKTLTKDVLSKVSKFSEGLSFSLCNGLSDWNQVTELFAINHPKSVETPIVYASPQSMILVARRAGKIVGSLSLIQAGIMPLPNSKSINLSLISSSRNRLIEITDICVGPDESNDDFIRTLLIKYAMHFILNAFSIERFILSDIDSKNTKLLEELALGCLNKNFPRSYPHRLGHKATFYYGSYESIAHKLGSSAIEENTDLLEFLKDIQNSNFDLPSKLFQRSNLLPLDPQTFRNLFPMERLAELDQRDLRNIRNCFLQSPEHLELLPICSLPSLRNEVRHPVRCDAIELDDQDYPIPSSELTIVSVARKGVAFLTEDFKPKKGSLIKLRIEVGHNILSDIQVKVGTSYDGMITGKVINKDHYWSRFHNFLCSSFSS